MNQFHDPFVQYEEPVTNPSASYPMTQAQPLEGQKFCCNTLLNQVYLAGFAIDDAILFLDTHPHDQKALAYYQQAQALYQNAVQAYETQCGPLFMTNETDQNYWTWINDPWPWEGGCI